jgi:hypothetical protein
VLVQPGIHSVFPSYSAAGRNWCDGADLYTATGYRYSPLVAVAMTPFSRCGAWGDALWHFFNASVLVAGLFARFRRGVSSQSAAIYWLLVLPLSLSSLNNGQANALVLGLLLLSLEAVECEGWNSAAAFIAAAGAFKIYPLLLGAALACLHPRRLGVRLALMVVVALALPFAFQRPDYVWHQYLGWVEHLKNNDRQVLPLSLAYRDFRLIGRTLGAPMSMPLYMLVQAATAGVLLGVCSLLRERGSRAHSLVLALCTVWMVAFGPSTEASTFILVAPSLAEGLAQAAPGWRRSALIVLYLAITYPQLPLRLPAAGFLSEHAVQPLALLLFGGWVLFELWRRPLMYGVYPTFNSAARP